MMSENVIEKLADGWRDRLAEGRTVGGYTAAGELQAATRPEQFMPPLSEWPDDAIFIQLTKNYASVEMFYEDDNEWTCSFEFIGADGLCCPKDGLYAAFPLNIPRGIDPRIKVSRAQMEAYKNG